jgi:hypothetical protein
MRDENRNAVRNRNSENDSALRREMSICFARPEQAFPSTVVCDDGRSVNLPSNYGAPGIRRELILKPCPSRHDFTDRIGPRETERAGIACCRERANAESGELSYVLTIDR